MKLALAGLLATIGVAHADAPSDVKTAFGKFLVERPTTVEVVAPVLDVGELGTILGAKPTLENAKVMVDKAGTAAWIYADIPKGKVARRGKDSIEPLRASGFLVKDATGWTVATAHVSAPMPNVKHPGCNMLDFEWNLDPSVPAGIEKDVKAIVGAIKSDDTAPFVKLMSDDKAALAIGSAAKEMFVGGAAIKALFKKFPLGAEVDHARANVSPDGAMMWIFVPVNTPAALCTQYRAYLVLAKEASGWRIVHQHYSEPVR